jgi:hypothetical protein
VRRAVLYYLTKEAPVQFSGIACQWKKRPDGGVEMLSLQIQGRPLDEQRMYTCAASDYFVGEAKRYIGVEIPRVIYLRQTVFEAVENAVRHEKVITPSSQRHFLMVNP